MAADQILHLSLSATNHIGTCFHLLIKATRSLNLLLTSLLSHVHFFDSGDVCKVGLLWTDCQSECLEKQLSADCLLASLGCCTELVCALFNSLLESLCELNRALEAKPTCGTALRGPFQAVDDFCKLG